MVMKCFLRIGSLILSLLQQINCFSQGKNLMLAQILNSLVHYFQILTILREQIVNLLIVNLHIRNQNMSILRFLLINHFKNISQRKYDNSFLTVSTEHGVCFATSSLSVHKYGGVTSILELFYQSLTARIIYFSILTFLGKHIIVRKLVKIVLLNFGALSSFQEQRRIIVRQVGNIDIIQAGGPRNGLNIFIYDINSPSLGIFKCIDQRSHSNCDFDILSFFHLSIVITTIDFIICIIKNYYILFPLQIQLTYKHLNSAMINSRQQMKANNCFQEQFFKKLLLQMKDLVEVTYELKITVYKMIGIPVQDISFKIRNDPSSILTNIKSIYFDLKRIQTIISKNSSKHKQNNISKNTQLNKFLSYKSHSSFVPLKKEYNQVRFHSQVDSQVNLGQNYGLDLSKTIKYCPSKKQVQKGQFLRKQNINRSNCKQQQNYYNLNNRNYLEQKQLKISNKLDIQKKQLNETSKRSNINISLKDFSPQQLNQMNNFQSTLQKLRKNRKQFLQYIRQKQKNCLAYLTNIYQSSSIILSKRDIIPINTQKQNKLTQIEYENQRNSLRIKLNKQLDQI